MKYFLTQTGLETDSQAQEQLVNFHHDTQLIVVLKVFRHDLVIFLTDLKKGINDSKAFRLNNII